MPRLILYWTALGVLSYSEIVGHSMECGDNRNQWVHREEKDAELLGYAALEKEIQWWYQQSRLYPLHPDESSIFSLPLETFLQMPYQRRVTWLDRAKATTT